MLCAATVRNNGMSMVPTTRWTCTCAVVKPCAIPACTGVGGWGASFPYAAVDGASGGGGGGYDTTGVSGGGGGVGLQGQGTNGAGGTAGSIGGKAGSSGVAGSAAAAGGAFGGGAGGSIAPGSLKYSGELSVSLGSLVQQQTFIC